MLRHILIVAFCILLSYLLAAAGGLVLYKIALSTGWPEAELGAIVRYVIEPTIAAIVGAVVGFLAKSMAGVLAAISLAPWVLLPVFSRRLDARHRVIILLLTLLYVGIGSTAAWFVLRTRTRRRRQT